MPDHAANRLVERKLKITRVFDAPRRVVFKAWTDPEQLARWWGPRGFTNPLCEVDARPGGAIRIIMRAPDGVSHEMKGVFREINEPERLVFTNRAIGSQGEPLLEGLTTVSFTEQEGKTTMTLETSAVALLPEARAMLNGMNDGWNQSLERLTMVLGG
ncbi:MAG TPA: SRPBCC domain-containing protein [Candidatus Binataceae bacterium]